MRRLPTLALTASLLAIAGSAAHAQQQPSPASGLDGNASAEADRYFQLGKEASKARKLPEAYENYRRAWELKQSPDIACNLGNVELELAKVRDAAEHLAHCVRNYPPSGTAEGKQYASERLEKVRKEVGSVAVEVTVDDATVFVDGKRVGRSPVMGEVFVDPGEHVFEAKLPGYVDAKSTVAAAKGGSHKVRLELVADAKVGAGLGGAGAGGGAAAGGAGGAGGTPDPGGGGSKKSVPLIVAGFGLGALGLGLGIGFLAASGSAGSDGDTKLAEVKKAGGGEFACTAPTDAALAGRCADLQSARDDQATFGALSAVMFITGGVAIAATATYLFLPSGSSNTTGTKGTVQATPVVGPHHAGAFVTATF